MPGQPPPLTERVEQWRKGQESHRSVVLAELEWLGVGETPKKKGRRK